MVIGLEQEPGILNGNIIGGDALATAYATAPLFSETYRLRPNLRFTPELVSHAKVRSHPFSSRTTSGRTRTGTTAARSFRSRLRTTSLPRGR
jgi:hypothetical protein